MRGVALAVLVAASAAAPVKSPPLKRRTEHPLVRPLCGALASCTAEACTLPIDIAKVRCREKKASAHAHCSPPDGKRVTWFTPSSARQNYHEIFSSAYISP